MRFARVFFVPAALICGCSHSELSANPAPSAAPSASASAPISAKTRDASADGLPQLTAPDVAIAALSMDISMREKFVTKPSADPDAIARYADLLLARAEYAGKSSDLATADQTTTNALKHFVGNGAAHFARASTLEALHRYDVALDELAQAEKMGVSSIRVVDARATIFEDVGRYDDALALRSKLDETTLPATAHAARAVLAAEMQKPDESEKLFAEAREKASGASPFPIAWMDFQHGIIYERSGDRENAKKVFAEANRILPTYTRASVRLAALETPERALAILSPLVDSTDDPDVLAGMTDALRRSGKSAEATAMQARAKARYDELLAKYPEAFEDHAAAFFLGPNGDVSRALSLAQANEKIRKTEPAVERLLTPAMASSNHAAICAAAADGAALKYASTAFRANITPLLAGCAVDAGTK